MKLRSEANRGTFVITINTKHKSSNFIIKFNSFMYTCTQVWKTKSMQQSGATHKWWQCCLGAKMREMIQDLSNWKIINNSYCMGDVILISYGYMQDLLGHSKLESLSVLDPPVLHFTTKWNKYSFFVVVTCIAYVVYPYERIFSKNIHYGPCFLYGQKNFWFSNFRVLCPTIGSLVLAAFHCFIHISILRVCGENFVLK